MAYRDVKIIEDGTTSRHALITTQHEIHTDMDGLEYTMGGQANGPGLSILWQHGPVDPQDGQTGAQVEDVLEAALDRLKLYDRPQSHPSDYFNARAITSSSRPLTSWTSGRRRGLPRASRAPRPSSTATSEGPRAKGLTESTIKPPYCLRCHAPGISGDACRWCKAGGGGFNMLRGLHRYAGNAAQLVQKAKSDEGAAREMGKALGAYVKALEWPLQMVVPIPLHHDARMARGFNQATVMAEEIAAVLDIPIRTDWPSASAPP